MDKVKQFLKEISEVCNRHGLKIGGCGCCGSPFVEKIKSNRIGGGYAITQDTEHPDSEDVVCDVVWKMNPQ